MINVSETAASKRPSQAEAFTGGRTRATRNARWRKGSGARWKPAGKPAYRSRNPSFKAQIPQRIWSEGDAAGNRGAALLLLGPPLPYGRA